MKSDGKRFAFDKTLSLMCTVYRENKTNLVQEKSAKVIVNQKTPGGVEQWFFIEKSRIQLGFQEKSCLVRWNLTWLPTAPSMAFTKSSCIWIKGQIGRHT